jgi:hypothetical protein
MQPGRIRGGRGGGGQVLYHAPTAVEVPTKPPEPPTPVSGLDMLRAVGEGLDLPNNRAVITIGEKMQPKIDPKERQPIPAARRPVATAQQPEPLEDDDDPIPYRARFPTANGVHNDQGLWRTRANVGEWTGAIRPSYPRIRRPYGTNTREMFLGKRYTGMYTTGFDASIVESKATPSFIPAQRKMVQDGAPAITDYIPALRSGGSEHVLFGVNHRR